MNKRKKEIKDIMLGIIAGKTKEPVRTFDDLKLRVTKVLHPRDEQSKKAADFAASVELGNTSDEPELSEDDWALFSEVYWDLLLERTITPRLYSSNPDFK